MKMSMSSYAVAFRPADEKWLKMKAIYDSCKAAKIDPPDQVTDFFNDEPPDSSGVEIDIRSIVEHYTDGDMEEDLQIDLTKLPKGVTVIRFVNSW
jgi:hypothetical protein